MNNTTNNPCIYSSFIFLINVVVGIYYQEYIYASLFVALFITSILFHSNSNSNKKTNAYYFLDLMVIFTIFIYGGYRFYKKIISKNKNPIISFIIIAMFLTTVYLFCYGYYSNQYCYNANKQVANLYHAILHIIGSLGHILIVLL